MDDVDWLLSGVELIVSVMELDITTGASDDKVVELVESLISPVDDEELEVK